MQMYVKANISNIVGCHFEMVRSENKTFGVFNLQQVRSSNFLVLTILTQNIFETSDLLNHLYKKKRSLFITNVIIMFIIFCVSVHMCVRMFMQCCELFIMYYN